MLLGTDRVYSTYESPSYEYRDYLVQDKDVHKDIYEKYEYLGEVYGDYNYLLSEKKREGFLQKIRSHETIEVILKTPLLGIMRGNKINFTWYINNSHHDDIEKAMSESKLINASETTPIMDDSNIESNGNDGSFKIDKSISGQYLITGCEIKFANKKWQYKVILSRPSSQKPKIFNNNE